MWQTYLLGPSGLRTCDDCFCEYTTLLSSAVLFAIYLCDEIQAYGMILVH